MSSNMDQSTLEAGPDQEVARPVIPVSRVHRMSVREPFESLSDTEKLYAHHLSR